MLVFVEVVLRCFTPLSLRDKKKTFRHHNIYIGERSLQDPIQDVTIRLEAIFVE